LFSATYTSTQGSENDHLDAIARKMVLPHYLLRLDQETGFLREDDMATLAVERLGRPELRLTNKLEQFLLTRPETPFLAVDLDVVESKYHELLRYFPSASIHYAVKANPAPEIVSLLAAMAASFDVASRYEIEMCLALGIEPHRLSYGNTIKKSADIAYAFSRGVLRYAFDSEAELRKLATHAPESAVMCRLRTTGENAGWPLSKKFGCDLEMAADLLLLARDLGLNPIGVSFHVGSQQVDPTQWRRPLGETAGLFRSLAREGLLLDTVNIGGGFPVSYESDVLPVSEYAMAIGEAMDEAFGSSHPNVMLEPGRSLVAEAGVIESEVVLVAQKSRFEETRWVYLDVGKFGGLAETFNESIKYRLRTARAGMPAPVVLAGPTCDSADILYEKSGYELPQDLQCGDRVEILNTGAYTTSYASVNFNGFPPLRTYCL
jgi:ornithine decarboxylase